VILDAARHPVLVARGKKDAWRGSHTTMGKARPAAAIPQVDGEPARAMGGLAALSREPDGDYFRRVTLNEDDMPIFDNGERTGVRGSSRDNDHEVARLAVNGLATAAPSLRRFASRVNAEKW
jgi:hypothetical protein